VTHREPRLSDRSAVPSSGVLPEPGRSAFRTLVVVLLTCAFAALGVGSASAAGRTLPQGNWEVLSASGSTVRVAGWALDRDLPRTSVQVHVYVDGRGAALVANGSRPDVGAAFPGAGNAHGFSHSRTVAAGVHSVCVYAIDVGNGARNTPFGCRSIAVRATLPKGNWERLSATGGTLSMAGWALDPDAPTAPVQVHVYLDGRFVALTANGVRRDVGAAFPGAGSAHGFSFSRTMASGVHKVCVYAIDVDDPRRNTPLGCRSVTTAFPPPIGEFEDAWVGPSWSNSGDMLYIKGWALDPNHPTEAATFHAAIDGRVVAVTGAARERPDVGSAYPGAGDLHGFEEGFDVSDFSFAPGAHEVCIVALAFLPTETLNTHLGCRQVMVPAER
jgi:hypothetical protein